MEHDDRVESLTHALDHAAHVLPVQGPLSVFVHHNTLHALQHKAFHDAIAEARQRLGVRGYLSEAEFRGFYRDGRIDDRDIDFTLAERPHRPLGAGLFTTAQLDRLALLHDLRPCDEATLQFLFDERDAGRAMQKDVPREVRSRWVARYAELANASHGRGEEAAAATALWDECKRLPLPSPPPPYRTLSNSPRDLITMLGATDPAERVNALMIRLGAAYLDEGTATWSMPNRGEGLYGAWRTMVLGGDVPMPTWMESLRREYLREHGRTRDAAHAVLDALDTLGLDPSQWEHFIERVLLELPGWAGMFRRLEKTPADRAESAPPASLMDYLAVRLDLSLRAWTEVAARELDLTKGPLLDALRAALPEEPHRLVRAEGDGAWRLFLLCQYAGVLPTELARVTSADRAALLAHLDSFDERARLERWQEAYERHYRVQVLGAIAHHRETARPKPKWQTVFCIDDREESFRRHLEELDLDVETLSTAGFFGVAMRFSGSDDNGAVAPLCPVNATPKQTVREVAIEAPVYAARQRRRATIATVSHGTEHATRSLFRAMVTTPLKGALAALWMPARLLFPRESHGVSKALRKRVVPEAATRLMLTCEGEALDPLKGFTNTEQADRIATSLQNMGLVRDFAPLVVLFGHGSISVNNPHLSAYDCGACGGRHGGPNARAFAMMANRPEVRALLASRGVVIPEGTHFIGGEHNTGSDEITLYDTDLVPATLRESFASLTKLLDRARTLNAHERCRRFASSPRDPSPERALRHVEERTMDLGQARPELGHVTNASAFVGRRSKTQGLFFDRRMFLQSYDPAIDPEGKILERILSAVVPVGGGISLEYYFSKVDNDKLGAGTKLPHNLVSGLGVMDGSLSDLKTGLPSQMIEIHEPMRLLCIVEATPETLVAITERQPEVREFVVNEWVQLVSMDPVSGALKVFERGKFVPFVPAHGPPPAVPSSVHWYRWRDGFLGPARIGAA